MLAVIEELVDGPDGELFRQALLDDAAAPAFVHKKPPPLHTGATPRGKILHAYLRVGWWVYSNLTQKAWFEGFIMVCILTVGVMVGLSLNGLDRDPAAVALVDAISWFTLVVFSAEAVLKVVGCGPNPAHYFTAPSGDGAFNCVNFVLVVGSWALIGQRSAAAVSTLRLIRLVRLLTFVKNVRELKVILVGLVPGLRSVAYIVALLLLVIFMFGVLGVMQFGENDPANFGVVPVAMLTLLQLSTLTSWSQVALTQWHGCDAFLKGNYLESEEVKMVETLTGKLPRWGCYKPSKQPAFAFFYFTAFTIVTAMVIMSLFIGVITIGMFDAYEEMRSLSKALEYRQGMVDVKQKLLADHSALSKGGAPPGCRRSVFIRTAPLRALHVCRPKLPPVVAPPGHAQGPRGGKAPLVSRHGQRVHCPLGGRVHDGRSGQPGRPGRALAGVLGGVHAGGGVQGDCGQVVSRQVPESGPLEPFRRPPRRCRVARKARVLKLHGIVAVFRLLRMLRVVRLLRALPRMRSIVESLVQGMGSVGWVVALMAIFNYILACAGVVLFQRKDPFHFATVQQALITIYSIETFDSWDLMFRINMYGCAEFPGG